MVLPFYRFTCPCLSIVGHIFSANKGGESSNDLGNNKTNVICLVKKTLFNIWYSLEMRLECCFVNPSELSVNLKTKEANLQEWHETWWWWWMDVWIVKAEQWQSIGVLDVHCESWSRLSILRESQCLYTRKKDMVWNSLVHLFAGRFVHLEVVSVWREMDTVYCTVNLALWFHW